MASGQEDEDQPFNSQFGLSSSFIDWLQGNQFITNSGNLPAIASNPQSEIPVYASQPISLEEFQFQSSLQSYTSSGNNNSDLDTMANIAATIPKEYDLQPTPNNENIDNISITSFDTLSDDQISLMSFESQPIIEDLADYHCDLNTCLRSSIDDMGLDKTAETVLQFTDLKSRLFDLLLEEANQKLKKSLTKSVLTSRQKKQDREYLLSLTPKLLCEELQSAAPETFRLITVGLLGIREYYEFYENNSYMNVVAMIYSTAAKQINRCAIAYAFITHYSGTRRWAKRG